MGRITDQHHLETRYFERMASSLGDKTRLLKYIPEITDPANPPHILDVGAGGGEFANALYNLGYKVSALDANEEAIERIEYKYPDLSTIHALANHASDFGLERFDVIICSSILHEVFSYGDDVHKAGHISSLRRALQSFSKALKPGGVLLIRDGVLPDDWEAPATVQLLPGHDAEVVHKYLDMCPFANGTAYGEQGALVQLRQVNENTFEGNVRSVMEFAYTYTWGLGSYPRETQEIYAPLTLSGYVDLLTAEGFRVTESFSYLQPGYPANLKDKMVLKVNGADREWFDSNAVWVAYKD